MGRAFSIHTFAGFLGGAVAPPSWPHWSHGWAGSAH